MHQNAGSTYSIDGSRVSAQKNTICENFYFKFQIKLMNLVDDRLSSGSFVSCSGLDCRARYLEDLSRLLCPPFHHRPLSTIYKAADRAVGLFPNERVLSSMRRYGELAEHSDAACRPNALTRSCSWLFLVDSEPDSDLMKRRKNACLNWLCSNHQPNFKFKFECKLS